MRDPEYSDHPVYDSHNLTGRAGPDGDDATGLLAGLARIESAFAEIRRMEVVAADDDTTYAEAIDAALRRLSTNR